MIDASFIEKVTQLARTEIIQAGGRDFSTNQLHPVRDPECEPITVHTLTGLVDGLHTLAKEYSPIIVVDNTGFVRVMSKLFGMNKQRECSFIAERYRVVHHFNEFISVEEFIIYLQSAFVRTEMVDNVLRIVGNLTQGSEVEHADDGVTQRVTARAGVARVEKVNLPNPLPLMPYRTFLEVDQPESMFVLRIKSGEKGPRVAIFEADGGAWKNQAILNIKEWLAEKTGGKVSIIA